MTAKTVTPDCSRPPGVGTAVLDLRATLLLLAPLLLLFILVLIVPLLGMLKQSLWDPALSLRHYEEIYGRELYARIIFRTLRVSAIVAVASLILGYPIAYLMARLQSWLAAVVGACVLLPLWTSVLVRSFAWSVLLSRNGLVNDALQAVGLTDGPPRLMFTEGAVIMAMTHVLLPFMVLPLYASLRTVPADLLSAAQGLGAGRLATLWHVIIPLSRPGISAGLVMVFVISLGFFITPALVGGTQAMMAASLIGREISSGGEWGLAAALSVLLLVAAFAVVLVFNKAFRLGRVAGVGQ